jgi:hypothetical protein
MKPWLIACLLACSTFAVAQDRVPVIAFDSVPDPLELPDNIYFGEVTGVAVNSKGHIFVLSRGNTTGPAYAAAAAQLLEFDPTASSFARSGTTSMHGRSAIQSVSIRRTTSG